jgi:3-hydroxyacyl-CoA dehydrogenase
MLDFALLCLRLSAGLDQVLWRVRKFARNPHGDPAFWTPAPLLERLGESGGSFRGASQV